MPNVSDHLPEPEANTGRRKRESAQAESPGARTRYGVRATRLAVRSLGVPRADKLIDISRSYEQVPIHERVTALRRRVN